MASTYSTNLAIELIGTGDQAGTWGNTTNTNLGTLIEQAISGYVTQAVATGTDTTITIPNGATGVARNMYIELTGTGGASTNLIVPANKKLYFIFNNTSSGQVTVKVSGQTGVSVPNKAKMILVSNGTDIVVAENYVADLNTNSITVTNLTATSATITTLTATSATITNLTSTSLTLSNNPVLNGGTANGVLYLNGSKVATSGSALTFDGSNLTVTGNLYMTGGSIAFDDERFVYSYAGGSLGQYMSGVYYDGSGVNQRFYVNNSESMRLTTTGLGIGTSSPSQKLEVLTSVSASTPAAIFRAPAGVGNSGGLAFYHNETSANARNWYFCSNVNAYGDFVIKVGASQGANPVTGTDVLTFSSSGNLGLGVTPSAWNTAGKNIQFGNGPASIGTQNSGDANFMHNAYESPGGTFKYINSGSGSLRYQLDINNNVHKWYYAASGTAGNTITFTQAMTLDSGGNLGVGTSSPQTRLHVVGGSTTEVRVVSSGDLTSGGASFIRFGGSNSATSGYLGYGGTGSTYDVYNGLNGPMTFSTNAAERARITSGGNLCVNTTDDTPVSITAHKLVVERSSTEFGVAVGYITDSVARTQMSFYNSNGSVGTISTDGSATAYNTSSDRRLKENIVPADDAGSVIDAIEIVKHDWKVGGHTRYGVIAQDLHAVAPEAVKVGDDNEEVSDPWGVDYSKLVPMLIKEVQSLRKRVAELEAK